MLGWDSNNKEWWTNIDKYESIKIKALGKKIRFKGKLVQGQTIEEYIIEKPDIVIILIDRLYRNIIKKTNKRTFNNQKQIKTFKNLSKR